MKHSLNKKFLIIDTETGGIDPQKHSILSIALLVWNFGNIDDTLYFYINEDEICINHGAYSVNSIDLKQIFNKSSKSKEEAKRSILKFIKRNFTPLWLRLLPSRILFKYLPKIVLCGKNVIFDYRFLKRIFGEDISYYFSHRMFDVGQAAFFLNLTGKIHLDKTNLYSIAECLNIDAVPMHNAYYDAKLVAKILNKLIVNTS